MRKDDLNKKKKLNLIYSIVLFIMLLTISFPSLSYPPLSDYWEMFYFFHHLSEKTGLIKWLHILNHDPWEHIRYQPLSRIFLYTFHLTFGSNFIFFNIFNFLFYFFNVLILYKFALNFSKNLTIPILFVGLFTFLFNHFDTVLWSFHIYILVGFCMFLLGFMSYIKYLKTGKTFFIFFMALFFISGMLCYESFFLWPLGIVILSSIKSLRTEGAIKKGNIFRMCWKVLSVLYAFYFLFYLFTRSINTYVRTSHTISDFIIYPSFIKTASLVFFNALYNNIAVNLFPLLSFPLQVAENIYMRGPIINYISIEDTRFLVIFVVGVIVTVLLALFFIYLYRKRYLEELKIIGFLLFLMLSEPYITFYCRTALNNAFLYNCTEFRYQYIPNAFIILIIIFVIDRFLILSKTRKMIMYILLLAIFVLNIYCIRKVINIYNYHFANLNKMLFNIKTDIRNGLVNKENKLYIDKDIHDYLPHLCWNIEMGELFIYKGNYQWMFSRREVEYFAESLNEAAWSIDKSDFSIVKKSKANIFTTAKKINMLQDNWYISLGKDQEYFGLGVLYKEQNNYIKAEAMFKKAIEMGSQDIRVYAALGELYKMQGKIKEAEQSFRKPIEFNPKSDSAYVQLGRFYINQKKLTEAEQALMKAIELKPTSLKAYTALVELYKMQGKLKEAEEAGKKLIQFSGKPF